MSNVKTVIGVDAHNLEGNRTGAGRYLFNLLQEWKIANCKSQIADCKFILYFKDEIPSDLPQSELFESKLSNVSSTAKFIHWDLWCAAKNDKVDILFCPAYVAPVFWRGKLALILHDIIYEARPEWFNWQSPADKILLKWVSKKAARKAKIIFTPSEFSRQEIIKFYQVAPEKVKMVSAAADPGLQLELTEDTQAEIEKIKIKYGLKDKYVFYVGSIFSRRHLPEIIEAFFNLAKERSDYQFLIGGKNYTHPHLDIDKLIEQKNNALGRKAIIKVDFIGDFDLKLLYSACAFFIYLSDYEGFGLPPLEAMSAGALVITSDHTSLKEVAGEAALLMKDNSDIQEIYRAMKQLVSDENLRNDLIKKGKEQAARFSWTRCAQDILNALMSV